MPDVHYKLGETARSAVDCIEAAADYLAKLPYIDSAHFGASGGSFRGYETNCLAALSHKFCTLVPVSGMTDAFSGYGNIPGLRDEEWEWRQGGLNATHSRDPARYVRNSPVCFANQVTTPILIVSTISDGNVNPQQGIEWFINLRREGKPVWMLRYQESSHGVWGYQDQKDLCERMNEFFDHYLKGAPAPKWMTLGPGLNTKNDFY